MAFSVVLFCQRFSKGRETTQNIGLIHIDLEIIKEKVGGGDDVIFFKDLKILFSDENLCPPIVNKKTPPSSGQGIVYTG